MLPKPKCCGFSLKAMHSIANCIYHSWANMVQIEIWSDNSVSTRKLCLHSVDVEKPSICSQIGMRMSRETTDQFAMKARD